MAVRSRTAPSISFASRVASPTPMLTTIFVSRGICMTLAKPNSDCSAGAMSSRYRASSRGSSRVGALMASEVLTGAPRDPDAAAFLVLAVTDPGRLVLGVDHHHVAHVDGRLLRDDPALLGAALGR